MELIDLLRVLRDQGGSDLHLAPESVPRIRIDGQLKPMELPVLTDRAVRQFAEQVLTEEQQGQLATEGQWDGAYTASDVGRFRLHVSTQRGSLAMAVRAVSNGTPSLDELGVPMAVENLIRKSQGLVLVTGPTGSGKSTTLAAMLNQINIEREAHIVSLEDPIEVVHSNKKSLVSQLEVGADTRDFQTALKGMLRQDPDVVFLGELRDCETIHAALTMAETGHLTVATLHTNSAIQSLTRLISVFPAYQQPEVRAQLSMVLEGVLSQRLVPRAGGVGRVLAMEILILSPAIRNLIREDKLHQVYSMMQTGQMQYGMQTMTQSLADLVHQKVITLDAALTLAIFPDELMKLVDRTSRAHPAPMAVAGSRPRG